MPTLPSLSQAARSPDISSTTQEHLGAMLRGAGSPLVVSVAEAALVVEASSADLIAWLRTPEFGELVFLTQVCVQQGPFWGGGGVGLAQVGVQ